MYPLSLWKVLFLLLLNFYMYKVFFSNILLNKLNIHIVESTTRLFHKRLTCVQKKDYTTHTTRFALFSSLLSNNRTI